MNYIETCTKIAVFLWWSSNYRPLKSVQHVQPGWIIYQNMREKKVMKFEREIPIGLDARRKKWQGGGLKKPPPPPHGIRVKNPMWSDFKNLKFPYLFLNSFQFEKKNLKFRISAYFFFIAQVDEEVYQHSKYDFNLYKGKHTKVYQE